MKDFNEFADAMNSDEFYMKMGNFLHGMAVGSARDGKPIDQETVDAATAAAHYVCLEMLRSYHEWVSR